MSATNYVYDEQGIVGLKSLVGADSWKRMPALNLKWRKARLCLVGCTTLHPLFARSTNFAFLLVNQEIVFQTFLSSFLLVNQVIVFQTHTYLPFLLLQTLFACFINFTLLLFSYLLPGLETGRALKCKDKLTQSWEMDVSRWIQTLVTNRTWNLRESEQKRTRLGMYSFLRDKLGYQNKT